MRARRLPTCVSRSSAVSCCCSLSSCADLVCYLYSFQATMSEEIPNDGAAGEDKKKTEAITIRVKDQVRVLCGWSVEEERLICSLALMQSGEETFFKVKPNTKMEKIFSAYAQRKGVPPSALRFLLDGTRISGDQTPKMVRGLSLIVSFSLRY